jgi:hypothetical protein
MLLCSSRPNRLFALVAYSENLETEPCEVARYQGLEESCERAREFAESTPGVESVTVCEVLRSGELDVSEACFLG